MKPQQEQKFVESLFNIEAILDQMDQDELKEDPQYKKLADIETQMRQFARENKIWVSKFSKPLGA